MIKLLAILTLSYLSVYNNYDQLDNENKKRAYFVSNTICSYGLNMYLKNNMNKVKSYLNTNKNKNNINYDKIISNMILFCFKKLTVDNLNTYVGYINDKKYDQLVNELNYNSFDFSWVKNTPITELEKKIVEMIKDYEKGSYKEDYQLDKYTSSYSSDTSNNSSNLLLVNIYSFLKNTGIEYLFTCLVVVYVMISFIINTVMSKKFN